MQTGKPANLGTAGPREDGERGFLMVALLVAMAVAAVYMTAALPAWRQQAQREKEEELIFRGEQYARALMLYQEKNRGVNPPDIDVLVSQHYLRKKWKDPVTGEDFLPLGIGVGTPGSGSQPGTSGGSTSGQQGRSGGGQPLSNQNPGVSGVRSKSDATSIKIYQQQQQYSLWQFNAGTYRSLSGRNIPAQGQNPGGPGGPGAGGPRGGPQGAPGGPGGAQGGATGPRGGGSMPPPPPGGGGPPGPRSGGSN